LAIAEREGYGRRIECLHDDILREVEDRRRGPVLENGLPYLIEVLADVSTQTPLLQNLIH
jgi:hypothetical protein